MATQDDGHDPGRSLAPSDPRLAFLMQLSAASLEAARRYADTAASFVDLAPYRRVTIFGAILVVAAVAIQIVVAQSESFRFPIAMTFGMLVAGSLAIVVGAVTEAWVGNAAGTRADRHVQAEGARRGEIERQAVLAGVISGQTEQARDNSPSE